MLAALLALAVTAMSASCGYPTMGGQKLCDLGFLPAQPIVTGPNVLGTMWAQCGPPPPTTHHLVLSLERKVRGADWASMAEEISNKIPGVERTSYQVKASCQAGIWRIKADVTGMFQGKDYAFSDTSRERVVGEGDCKPD